MLAHILSREKQWKARENETPKPDTDSEAPPDD